MKLYFMGLCGTAMGNAALLTRAAGHEVIGADSAVYPPMSTVLSEAGIVLHEGYDPGRLQQLAPDLVVIGNAMSRGNPEVEWLLDTRAIPVTSLPALLHDFVLRRRENIVVAGTHGKTTTTALTAFLLRENGRDPGFLIGGVPQDPPMGNHLGALTDPFVIEGDEYDSAFFDKRSKFIHYAPRIAVLNNLEFDHADIFRDLTDVKRTFTHFGRIVPRNGWIVLNGDDENIRALGTFPWTQTLRVGLSEDCDVRLVDFNESTSGATFTLTWFGEAWTMVSWQLPGLYNARNAAMAASAALLALTKPGACATSSPPFRSVVFPRENIDLGSLSRFRGVKRRQEVLVATPTITVIEDFGHHPTALAETLRSFRNRFKGMRITAVFEPRSNTARTNVMQAGFTDALSLADDVFLGPVNRPDKLKPSERFDSEGVTAHLNSKGVRAAAPASNADVLTQLLALMQAEQAQPRLVVFFSNGNFDGIIAQFAESVRAHS